MHILEPLWNDGGTRQGKALYPTVLKKKEKKE